MRSSPINRPLNAVNNNQRDGFARQTINQGRVAYFPNALAGGCPMHQPKAVDSFKSYAEKIDGQKIRARSKSFTDYFSQATLFWNSMADWEKDHIVDGFSFELNNCETKAVPQAVMANILVNIAPELASRVADKTGLDIKECKRVAPKPVVTQIDDPAAMPSGTRKVTASPALSMNKPSDGIKGRKVAVLAGEGTDGNQLADVMSTLSGQHAIVEIIAEKAGTFTCSLNKTVNVTRPAPNAPSVIYDAVVIPGGKSASKVAAAGLALAFVAEAFKHGKPILAMGEGAAVLQAAHLPGIDGKGAPAQGVLVGTGSASLDQLITAMKQHRFHNRDIAAVPA